ncbi:DUF1194 domain-containing protein [Celeribacter neptunius]|uniref:VWFA domain-containing protein n=1 Tax=Celeribacter neptunius TaxID=588602 RepID=A0A1I3IV48_9RHOB|nr:DUF1194 domain-containing protein [Celeribacter neptunius]SFI51818.1 Protein of unknown function [Celeribacter neptunius]
MVKAAAILAATLFSAAAVQAETCRQALALGLDVSGSVDAQEWQLQVEGLARALNAPEVQQAFLAMEGAPVSLAVYEWAGDASPRTLIGWTAIRSRDDLADVQAQLRTQIRVPHGPGTAMGEAMRYGGALLAQKPECWRYTLDISADGKSNMGPRPERVRFDAALADVTINGLIVSTGSDMADPAAVARELDMLERYFHGAVIKGFGAFVERARNYSDYERAMTRKLLKELQTVTVGWLDMPDQATWNTPH